jgi:hypothetical protein
MPAILTPLRLTDTKTFTCGVVAPTYAVAAGEGGATKTSLERRNVVAAGRSRS